MIDNCMPDPIPSSYSPNGLIAPFWRDLNPSKGGQVTYLSDVGKFVVTWDKVPDYSSRVPQTFQVIIYSSGDIVFQYKEIYPFGMPTSIGVENQTGTQGKSYSFTFPSLIQFHPRHYTSLVWGFPDSSVHADEVNAFFHVNRIHDYIHKTLEMPDDPNFMQVKVDVFSPIAPGYESTNKTIYLYDHPSQMIGWARESDIIYHEYGHFFQHSIYDEGYEIGQGKGKQFTALLEGYADYFACSLTDDPIIYSPAKVFPVCSRDISEFRKYPDDYTPEWENPDAHENGRILSNTLWEIRDEFDDLYVTDVDKTDADFLAIRTLLIEPRMFVDISDWLVCLDLLFYSGNHCEMIEDILDFHGIKEEGYSIHKINYNWIGTFEDSNIRQDNQIQEFNLQFTFNFFGQAYNKVYVSDNGFICFEIDTNNPSSPYPFPIPNVNKPNAVIAPLWADFNPIPPYGMPSNIDYLNDLDKFAVSWSPIKFEDPNLGIVYYMFQAILYDSGDIVFNYNYTPYDYQKYPHTIGIENETGTKGITYLESLLSG